MKVEVTRSTDNGIQTLGTMNVINENDAVVHTCYTLELPWKDNASRISCIPKGAYICTKRNATANIPYRHILINGVSGRAGVCIHKGNYHTQIRGCLLVGNKLFDINKDGQLDVQNSGVEFDKIMALMPDEFKLTIK